MAEAHNVGDEKEINLEELAEDMYKTVEIKSRDYQGKTYEKVFLGTEAVDYLLKLGVAETREGCVQVGNLLMGARVFVHCVRDHPFLDQEYFYRFTTDEAHGEKVQKNDGEVFGWSDFLGKNMATSDLKLQPSQVELDEETMQVESVLDIAPLDCLHNQKLLNNCHPPMWKNPTNPPEKYNLVAIGGGAGGLVSVAESSRKGAKCAIIEKHLYGGDCLVAGCVPSKALLKCAKIIYNSVVRGKEFGLTVENYNVDFGAIFERMRKIRADISPADSAEKFTKLLGVDVFIGTAIFTGKNTIKIGDQEIKFAKCIIASGGTPTVPNIPGLKNVRFMTNLTFFNQTTRPKRLGVIGCGPIGAELSQAMSLFGSEVHIFNRSAQILGKEDPEAAEVVKGAMEESGCKFYMNSKLQSIEYAADEPDENGDRVIKITYEIDGETSTVEVDRLLIATGRKPNVEGFGLDVAGVKYDARGGVEINDFLQTSNPDIYAVGDCCTRYQFTHVSDKMAKIAHNNALFSLKQKFSDLVIPWVTYTHPEVAHVGLYEADCEEKGIAYDKWVAPHKHNDRAICDGETKGFTKILCKKGTDTIIGATVVAESAGDILMGLTVSMTNGVGLEAIGLTIHPYPTVSMTAGGCGNQLLRSKITPLTKDCLRKIMNMQQGIQ